jgi:hypothetical protein
MIKKSELGVAGRGKAWPGEAGQGMARRGKAWHGKDFLTGDDDDY